MPQQGAVDLDFRGGSGTAAPEYVGVGLGSRIRGRVEYGPVLKPLHVWAGWWGTES